MLDQTRMGTDDKYGLIIAVGLHGALLALLLMSPFTPPAPEIPARMTVSLVDDVGLKASAVVPVPESRMATAPDISEALGTPQETMPQEPVAKPLAKPQLASRSTVSKPPEKTQPRPAAKPKRSKASQSFDQAFAGTGQSRDTSETRSVASVFGTKEQADLSQAINRALKKHWHAPQGVDAEKLVTVLSWRLNRDGSLAGRPRVVSQSGVNAANRAQAHLHAERAIRAVQLSAPFDLPAQFYDEWKYIRDWRFDRRL